MKQVRFHPKTVTILSATVGLAILLLAFLRFVNISADPPQKLTSSGVLYTDEGWYSKNAVAYMVTGNWHVEGDFNPAVNIPVFPLILGGSFKLLGMGLASARTTDAIFFLLLLLANYALVRKHEGHAISLLSTLFLCASFVMFAYSRLALLEIPMTFFVVISILAAVYQKPSGGLYFTVIAVVFMMMAFFTKTSAIFGFVLLAWITFDHSKNPPLRIVRFLTMAVVAGICLLVYYLLLARPYRADYEYFTHLNVASNLVTSPKEVVLTACHAVFAGVRMDALLYPLAVVAGFLGIVTSKELRQNSLFRLSLIWLLAYLAMLSVINYHPPRYYLPLMPPMTFIAAKVLVLVWQRRPTILYRAISGLFVVLYLVVNVGRIVAYLASPQWSFLAMIRDVEKQMGTNKVLLGNFADTIGLETGIFSINDTLGTEDLHQKVLAYSPTHFIGLGEMKRETRAELETDYDIQRLRSYDVLNNYYTGKSTILYELVPKHKSEKQ